MLGLREGDVTWARIRDKASKTDRDQTEWSRKFDLLQNASDSDWYFDISQYRNFAHRAFPLVTSEYDGHFDKTAPTLVRLWLVPTRKGQDPGVDILADLPDDVKKMQDLADDVLMK